MAPPSDTFIAFESSFQGFRQWEAFPLEGTEQAPAHLAGPRVVYLNRRPHFSDGGSAWPVGTIIVKEFTAGAVVDRQVFAMVKRGGSTNLSGAVGWEWWELQNLDEQTVRKIWRGVGPPSGEQYGGDPTGGCNGCHSGSASNDFVHSLKLADAEPLMKSVLLVALAAVPALATPQTAAVQLQLRDAAQGSHRGRAVRRPYAHGGAVLFERNPGGLFEARAAG